VDDTHDVRDATGQEEERSNRGVSLQDSQMTFGD
jgi:hypothetical protein